MSTVSGRGGERALSQHFISTLLGSWSKPGCSLSEMLEVGGSQCLELGGSSNILLKVHSL